MAAMERFNEGNAGIGQDLGSRFRKKADKRIVLRAENERGNGDAIDHAGAGGAVVVIIGVAKAAVRSYDLLVVCQWRGRLSQRQDERSEGEGGGSAGFAVRGR